jgi:hypothetical protein
MNSKSSISSTPLDRHSLEGIDIILSGAVIRS